MGPEFPMYPDSGTDERSNDLTKNHAFNFPSQDCLQGTEILKFVGEVTKIRNRKE